MVEAVSIAIHLPPLCGFGENAPISWDWRPRLSPIAALQLKDVGKGKDGISLIKSGFYIIMG
jgi:hypothetical protein